LRLPVIALAPLQRGITREELRLGLGYLEEIALYVREEGIRLLLRELSLGLGVVGLDCALSSLSRGRSI
jgi:hypothetical protein